MKMNAKHCCPVCRNKLTVEKVEHSGGMDGRYRNWRISCDNCHLINIEYPADSFYGREYYETPCSALERFDEYCQSLSIIAKDDEKKRGDDVDCLSLKRDT